MTTWRMRLDLWFLFSCCFLTLGSALNCSLIQDNDQPTLVISGLPKVPAVYTWANSSGHVLAQNDQETPGLVLRNTNTTLVTSGCIEDVYYTSTIVSTAERYTAHCQVNCTENAHLWETKEPPHISPLRAVLVALVALIPCIVVMLLVFRYRSPLFTAVKKALTPRWGTSRRTSI